MSEFDLSMPLDEWLQVPRLWCWVSEVSPGKLSVVPVYRGRQFWASINDDSAVGEVLDEMQQRNGYDVLEWQAFVRRVVAKNQKALAELAKDKPVN